MKKCLLTIISCAAVLPLFAFDFNEGNIKIDANIKAGINAQIAQSINNAVKENVQNKTQVQMPDNKIISAIKEEMKFALKNINRNVKLRKKFPNRKFVEEQKIQKQRYTNMDKWNIPSKIYTYIENNFDVRKVEYINVICKYVNETGIDIRFSYEKQGVRVSYTYTDSPQNILITHKVFK